MEEKFKEIFTEDLVAFADEFSKNYKIFSLGDYFSNNKKYHIQYVEEIVNTRTDGDGNVIVSPVRLGRIEGTSKRIDLSKSDLLSSENITPDYVFYLILWLMIYSYSHDAIESDLITIEYYLKTSRSRKMLLIGNIELFNKSFKTQLSQERYSKIFKFIDSFSFKK